MEKNLKKNSELTTQPMKKVQLFKHQFGSGTEEDLNELIFNHILTRPAKSQLVLVHYNLHLLYLCIKHKELKRFITSVEFCWIDGFPIILLMRLGGIKMPIGARCTFLDWQHSFFNNAERFKCSIFLLGADKDTIELTHKKLAHQYPQVRFNSHHGYFENDGDIVSIINKCHVDILLVGMGMPKQELWISKNLAKINSRVVMPIGGYFDYIGEKTHTPNRFWSNIGLEWIIRLIHDPKRLSYRYLVEPWYVLIAFIKYTFSRPR